MSLDQALCREVALLLSQKVENDDLKKGQDKSTAAHVSALLEQASMFATTWHLISNSLDHSPRPAAGSTENLDTSDMGVCLSTLRDRGNSNDRIKMKASDIENDKYITEIQEEQIKTQTKNDFFLTQPSEIPTGIGRALSSESAYEFSTSSVGINSAGAPSTAESFHGIGIGFSLQEASDILDEHQYVSQIKKRTSSQTFNKCPLIHEINSTQTNPNQNNNSRSSNCLSSATSDTSKKIKQEFAGGINSILECCSSTVGSTHRSASQLVPRGAQEYVQLVRDAHAAEVESDIPSKMFKYLVGSDLHSADSNSFNSNTILRDSRTPIIEEGPSPINRSFLNCVNDELKKIEYDQVLERSTYAATNDDLASSTSINFEQSKLDIQGKDPMEETDNRSSGYKRRTGTIIINCNVRNQVKVESSVQTEIGLNKDQPVVDIEGSPENPAKRSSSGSTPTVWGNNLSEESSQISSLSSMNGTNLGFRRLKQQLYPINPDATSVESLLLCEQQQQLQRKLALAHRNSGMFGNLMNMNTALGITKYSLQAAWNTAEEVFRGYIVPPEVTEERGLVELTAEERAETENKISVSLMRLMGLPMESRQTIYREVLGDMQAIHEFSVETVQMISSVIDWICRGNHSGTDDLLAKTRLLATSQTEVDMDCEGWKNFERDIGLFTTAVTSAVGSAARMVSRQCTADSCESLNRSSKTSHRGDHSDMSIALNSDNSNSIHIPESAMSIHSLNSTTTAETTNISRTESQATTATTRESDYDIPVNPALIAQMVTDSEFEFNQSPLSRTNSIISTVNGQRRGSGSRIPLPIISRTGIAMPNSTSKTKMSTSAKAVSERDSKLNIQVQAPREHTHVDISQNKSCLKLNPNNSSRNIQSHSSFSTSEPKAATSKSRKTVEIDSKKETGCFSSAFGSKNAKHQLNQRERMLSFEDAELLRECRRLTNLSTESSKSPSGTVTSILHNGMTSNESSGRNSRHQSNQQIAMIGITTEMSVVASAIATVASCVTTALLGRAASAASYIPSFSDTFGPQVDEEYRFPESIVDLDIQESESFLESIQKAANTASNILFGVNNSMSAENTAVTSRPSNRKIRSRNTLTPTSKMSSAEQPINVSSHAQPVKRDDVHSAQSISGINPNQRQNRLNWHPSNLIRQESLNNNSVVTDSTNPIQQNTLPISSLQEEIDPAWQLFDYIKRQEAEFTSSSQKNENSNSNFRRTDTSENGVGINEQSPPHSEENIPKASITARLSKAALHGLFNTFQESGPSNCAQEDNRNGSNNNNGSLSETTGRAESAIKADASAKLEEASALLNSISQVNLDENWGYDYYRSQSGHNYTLNENHSSSYNNLIRGRNDLEAPSMPLINVPHNSDINISRQIAENRMHEDIAYLENIVNALYESNLIDNPTELESDSDRIVTETNKVTGKHKYHNSSTSPEAPAKLKPVKTPQERQLQSSLKKVEQGPQNRQSRPGTPIPLTLNSPSKQSRQTSNMTVPNTNLKNKSFPIKATTDLNARMNENQHTSQSNTPTRSRPRIVHQIQPCHPTRSTPVKPVIKVISAVPGYLAQTPSPCPGPTVTTPCIPRTINQGSESNTNYRNNQTIVAPRPQRPSSNGGNPPGQGQTSYLTIAKQKSTVKSRLPVQGQPHSRGNVKSYSLRQNDHAHEANLVESVRTGSRGLSSLSTSTRNPPASSKLASLQDNEHHDNDKSKTVYKYDDGTHPSNSGLGSLGSSKCPSPNSSVPTSHNPSRHHNCVSIIGNRSINCSDRNKTPENQRVPSTISGSVSPSLFFPPLENKGLTGLPPLPGIVTNAFTKLRGDKK